MTLNGKKKTSRKKKTSSPHNPNTTRKKNKTTMENIPRDVMRHTLSKYLNGLEKTIVPNVSNHFSNIFTEDFEESDILLYISEQLSWLHTTEHMMLPKKYIKDATLRIALYIEYDDGKYDDTKRILIYITSDGQYAYDLYDGVFSMEELNDLLYDKADNYHKLRLFVENLNIKNVKSTGDPIGNINNAITLLKNAMHTSDIKLTHFEFTLSNINFLKDFSK